MGRILLSLLFLTQTAAAVVPCDPDPPLTATPAPPAVLRLLQVAAEANRYPLPAGLAAVACIGRTGVFYSVALLPPADVEGPAMQAPGLAVLAWLLGNHQFHHGGRRTDADADRTGARFAGCALAHVGARGNALTAQVQHLEAATAPHSHADAWRAALGEGYDRCAR